jgi:hypothetical protein
MFMRVNSQCAAHRCAHHRARFWRIKEQHSAVGKHLATLSLPELLVSVVRLDPAIDESPAADVCAALET